MGCLSLRSYNEPERETVEDLTQGVVCAGRVGEPPKHYCRPFEIWKISQTALAMTLNSVM